MRKRIRVAASLLFAGLIPLLAPAAARSQPAPHPAHAAVAGWLEENVPLLMEEAKMPGFSIAVVKDGATIYAEGFGSRNPARNLPATADTLYGIGSITKSFVAIGILQLVEAGDVALDDPVNRHLPFELGIPGQPITVHHLLTHSLGIPSLATSTVAIYRGLGHDTGVPLGSAKDFYRLVNGAGDEVVAPPGERFFYHNAAWRMLGHLLQEKSGLPFHRYLQERIIDPLGMERTTLDVAAFEGDADRIVPHRKDAEGVNQPSRFPYPNPEDNPDFSFLSGAGGILSSVREMTRYLNVLIDRGRHPSGRLAGEASFETMQTLQIRTPDRHYGARGYGYGLTITPDFLGHKMVSHGGSVLVSTAYLAALPELRAGVIMMGNSSGMPYSTIAESVFAVLLGKDPDAVIPARVIRERMGRLAGRYQVYRGLDAVEVVIQGGLLYLERTSPLTSTSSRVPLTPEDPPLGSMRFYILSNGFKSPVEFRVGEGGKTDLFVGRYCYHQRD